MMRMTYASLMQFLLRVDMSIMKHLVVMAEQKGCHGNYNGNGATATFW